MSQVVSEEKDCVLGNTKRTRHRKYIFVWNNYTKDDLAYLENYCNKYVSEYVYQEETGECGTRHIQGVLEFKNQIDFATMKKDFPKCHIEACRNIKAQIAYCSKPETRTGQVFTNKKNLKIRESIKDFYSPDLITAWQNEILEIIKSEPDRRKIFWYWDDIGNTGKSTFARHLVIKYKAVCLSGKGNDIKFAIATILEERDIKICIFDIPRCNEQFVSYQALEEIKNGLFFCGKYESKQIVMNPPHIFIFANFHPNILMMSKDRWVITKIS